MNWKHSKIKVCQSLPPFSSLLSFLRIDRNDGNALQEAQAQLVQSLLEIEHLQTKLSTLEEEKVNSENQLNQTIDTLKTHFEELQAKQGLSNNRVARWTFVFFVELQANETLQERDAAIKQTQLTIEQLRSQLEEMKQQKGQSNDTMHSLTQELQALKAELDDRG